MAASRGVLPQGSIHGDTWRPPWIRSICENPGPGVAVRAMYHMSVEARWFGQVDRMEAQGARTAIWGPSMVDWTKVRDISVCLRLLHPISIHLDLVLSGIQSSHLLPPILQIFHGLLGHVRNHLRVSVGGGGGVLRTGIVDPLFKFSRLGGPTMVSVLEEVAGEEAASIILVSCGIVRMA
jgi:hypothetical protein